MRQTACLSRLLQERGEIRVRRVRRVRQRWVRWWLQRGQRTGSACGRTRKHGLMGSANGYRFLKWRLPSAPTSKTRRRSRAGTQLASLLTSLACCACGLRACSGRLKSPLMLIHPLVSPTDAESQRMLETAATKRWKSLVSSGREGSARLVRGCIGRTRVVRSGLHRRGWKGKRMLQS